MAIDTNGNIYVTNRCTNTVTIYANGSEGDAAPTAIIGGPNTGLYAPAGIAVDSGGKIYVAAYPFAGGGTQVGSVFIYPALGSSTGLLNEAPIATISGSTTGLSQPEGIALDASGKIYVTGYNTNTGFESVSVYPALSSSGTGLLDEAPIATISGNMSGNMTDLSEPVGIALDSSQNIYVADNGATSVFVYPALGSSTGTLNEAPIATISGNITGLDSPKNIALDSSQNIYVTDDGATSVFVYPALGGSGWVAGPPATYSVAPTATISGSNTGLRNPYGIAVDSSGIYVADENAESVFLYSPLGSSTGLLNEAPISGTISTTLTTGLAGTVGIALDTVGNIYVAGNDFNGVPGVFVYAAGSNANAAPIATISGLSTGLDEPAGIALDSSGEIYVADEGDAGDDIPPSVFVYPALGNSTGLLDEPPLATISGSKTDLLSPAGIALDSSRNIYVADGDTTQRVGLCGAGRQHRDARRRPPRHHRREQHRPEFPKRHRVGFQRQHLCGEHPPQSVCLSGAGKQHRDARRGPHRHHQRTQDRPERSVRHCGGFQRQHLCGRRKRRERVCLSGAGNQRHRAARRVPHRHHQRSAHRTG